jgi:hypothetical protein
MELQLSSRHSPLVEDPEPFVRPANAFHCWRNLFYRAGLLASDIEMNRHKNTAAAVDLNETVFCLHQQ